jgi:hypothetical protein
MYVMDRKKAWTRSSARLGMVCQRFRRRRRIRKATSAVTITITSTSPWPNSTASPVRSSSWQLNVCLTRLTSNGASISISSPDLSSLILDSRIEYRTSSIGVSLAVQFFYVKFIRRSSLMLRVASENIKNVWAICFLRA